MPRPSVCCNVPVSADQSRTVLSKDPDATSFESGENATDLTQPSWPSSVCCNVPVSADQSRTVLSKDPDATSFESGENATE